MSSTIPASIREAGKGLILPDSIVKRAAEIWSAGRLRAPKPLSAKLAVCACILIGQEESQDAIKCGLFMIANFLEVFERKNWTAFGHYYNVIGGRGTLSRDPFMLLSQVSYHIPHKAKETIGFTAAKMLQRCPENKSPAEDIVTGALILACKGQEFISLGIEDIRRAFSKFPSPTTLGLAKKEQVAVPKYMPPCRRKRLREEARIEEDECKTEQMLNGLRAAKVLAASLEYENGVMEDIEREIQKLAPTTLSCIQVPTYDQESPLDDFDHELDCFYLVDEDEIMDREVVFDSLNPAFAEINDKMLRKREGKIKKQKLEDRRRMLDPMTPSEFCPFAANTVRAAIENDTVKDTPRLSENEEVDELDKLFM